MWFWRWGCQKERWEKKCGEAEKKIVKLQKEKDTEVRRVAIIKKDMEDLRDEKDNMEEILNGRIEEANNTRFETEMEQLQAQLTNVKKQKKEEISKLKKEKDKEIR